MHALCSVHTAHRKLLLTVINIRSHNTAKTCVHSNGSLYTKNMNKYISVIHW